MNKKMLAGLFAFSMMLVTSCALPGNIIKSGSPEPGIAFSGELKQGEAGFTSEYEMPCRKGQVVQVVLASLDFVPKLELSLGENKAVAEGSGASGGRISAVMLSDRDGVIKVRVSGDAAGSFLLKVSPRDIPRVDENQKEYVGKLATGDAVEYVMVELKNADVSVLVCRSTDFDSTIKVRLPNGAVMSNDDFTGESDAGVVIPGGLTGAAMVEIRSYNGEKPGAFTLAFRSASAKGTLQTGGKVEGRIDAAQGDDVVCYTLRASSDPRIISLKSDDFDTVLQVYANGKLVVENDDISGDNYNSQVFLTGNQQDLLLVVRDYENKGGAFAVTAEKVPAGRELVAGREIKDSIGENDAVLGGLAVDLYSFKGRAGQTITIDASWSEFDGKLTMVNSVSRSEENDDYMDEQHSRITYTFPVNETVYIMASGLGEDEKGDYSIIVNDGGVEPISDLASGNRTLAANGLFKGSLAAPSGDATRSTDEYVFTGKAGEMIVIEMLSLYFDPQLEVKGPEGFEMSNDDGEGMQKNSRLVFKCPADGEYKVIATSYDENGSGQYLLRFNRMKFTRLMQMSGVLSGGNVARHELQLRAGERVMLDVESDDFDTVLKLVDAAGKVLGENDDISGDDTNSQLVTQVPSNGTYYIEVSAYSDNEEEKDKGGSYTVTVHSDRK